MDRFGGARSTAQYLGEMSLPDKTKLFQEVENWLSMSMPLLGLTINGKEYNFTGMTIMDDDNENEKK